MFPNIRIFFAAAIALPLAALALAGWLTFRQVYGEAVHEAQHNAAALSEHALRTIRAHELIIEFVDQQVLGWSWKEITSSAELHKLLVRVVGRNRDLASIFVVAPSGRDSVSSRRFPMPLIDLADRDYFQVLRSADVLHVSRPFRGRLVNDRFFSVARRKSSADGGFDGVIAVSVNPEYFESFYASMLQNSEAASLVRSDGVVLARHPGINEAASVLPPGSAFMNEIRERPQAGVYTSRSLTDGMNRIFAYKSVGDYSLYTSFQLPMTSVWAAWSRVMIPYLAATLLGMALLLAGVRLAEQRARRAAAEARSREAEEASRAKDRFVAALSHELRNPLAAISVAAEVLNRSALGEPGARAASQIIGRQIAQLRRMLDDLLDAARAVYGKLSLERRRVDLYEIAAEVVSGQLRRTGERAAIRLEGAAAWVEGDPVRLTQMIDNLVDNAIKYGGRTITVRLSDSGEHVEAAVEDDGRGIPAELLPRLFEPFVQGEQPLDRAEGGLGLGLALVDRLATLHGGTLHAHSDGPGRGSRFTLRLPRSEPPARLMERVAPGAAELRWRMLVVDDEQDAREGMAGLLRMGGHEVIVSGDGAGALAAFGSFQPEVALVDIGLPGMDGYELARRLRALPQAAGAVLVAVTGYGQPEDRAAALAAGFDAHLTKPFTYDELLSVCAARFQAAAQRGRAANIT